MVRMATLLSCLAFANMFAFGTTFGQTERSVFSAFCVDLVLCLNALIFSVWAYRIRQAARKIRITRVSYADVVEPMPRDN